MTVSSKLCHPEANAEGPCVCFSVADQEGKRKILRERRSSWRTPWFRMTRIERAHRVSILIILASLLLAGCGYHTSNSAKVNLPSGINIIAIPIFTNKTQSYRAGEILTQAVVREFTSRSSYKVLNQDDGSADAVLRGVVNNVSTYPLTYDSQTGRQSSAIVQINMSMMLVDKHGKTLFENPDYMFREQYQVSREVTSFFDESPPAVDRLSRDFAHTLVAEILEGF